MSLECSECERDTRGGHDESCSRHPKNRGLYGKFKVERTDGQSEPGEKHDGCRYFVLDMTHDPGSIPALRAYAAWARGAGYGKLADDLEQWLNTAVIPPVDRTATTTTDGEPLMQTPETDGPDGQHKNYVVLNDAERAKGFVRPCLAGSFGSIS